MNWFARFRQLLADPPSSPAVPGLAKESVSAKRPAVPPTPRQFLETNRLIAIAILCATVLAILTISFVGVSPIAAPVLENQLASVRVVAADNFSYQSKVRTAQAREQLRSRVPPVYNLKFEFYRQFAEHVRELTDSLEKFEQQYIPKGATNRAELVRAHVPELTTLVEAFNARGTYRVTVDDIATILALGDTRMRYTMFENGLVTLNELYQEGISDDARNLTGTPEGAVSVYQIRNANSGAITQAKVQTREEALTFLRVNLAAEGVGREGASALFRLFRHGISQNLVADDIATDALRDRAVATHQPVVVTVQKGQVLIEPGTRVNREQYEALVEHRRHLLETDDLQVSGHLQLFGRMLLVLAMVLAAVFYIRLEDRASLASNSRLGLLALMVIVNLALVRVTYAAGELGYFVRNESASAFLPYLAPTALAPLILAVLIGSGPAIFMALVISLFTGVIYGNRLDLLVITLFASIVGVFHCRNARNRARVVRAGFLAGLCVAVFALLLGIADQPRISGEQVMLTVLKQMGAGLATGVLTGVVVAGLLPVLETLFRRTTDITLLELTDHNHPLLRLMQIEAPGTYHHSLWVANLAENAAAAIGANPLVCRAAALFHDVGKTTKADFFTENQRDRANPHDDCSPSVSAMTIKGHVKEGVDLARKHRLPKVIIDVIRQHHGTTLMQFFYHRAKKEARTALPDPAQPNRPVLPAPQDAVEEALYRYDGPKPQFKEAAIIFFADCVEAASRSLRIVTPQHLSELIDRLFKERIEDGQLTECSLTYQDVTRVKASFEFTLLNMLHSRVAYPIPDVAHAAPVPPAGGPLLSVPTATTADRASLPQHATAPLPTLPLASGSSVPHAVHATPTTANVVNVPAAPATAAPSPNAASSAASTNPPAPSSSTTSASSSPSPSSPTSSSSAHEQSGPHPQR